MSQDRKSRINYRCPNCFAKEVDVDLLYDKKRVNFKIKELILCLNVYWFHSMVRNWRK